MRFRFRSTAYLRNISLVPGSGFNNYSGGIIEVDLVYKNEPIKAVICDFDREGSKVGANILCYLLGR